MTLFALVMLVILWLFQVVFLDDFYKAIRTHDIKEQARLVAGALGSNSFVEDLNGIAAGQDVSVLVTDIAGNRLYELTGSPFSLIGWLGKTDFQKLIGLAGPSGSYLLSIKQNKLPGDFGNGAQIQGQPNLLRFAMRAPESIIYTLLAKGQNGKNYAVILYTEISPIDATVNTLIRQLFFITAIMLFVALCLAWGLSKKIADPIVAINNSSKALAKGDYNANFRAGGYKEIRELGETLSYAASELQKNDNLRRELIANISHDLRTPLTMIIGYAEVMRDLPGENTPENVQIVIDEAKRLSGLVNDVLDISKLQSGTEKARFERINLTESVRGIIGRYAKMVEQLGYRIDFRCGGDIWVVADELKISQVLYNLIGNAVNYTGSDKSVTITQLDRGETVRIEVADTGEGIPKDKLDMIWDRYYKIDKEHKRAQIGTGLGLSIVKAVLELHGASYGVISNEGQGSLFWFELKKRTGTV